MHFSNTEQHQNIRRHDILCKGLHAAFSEVKKLPSCSARGLHMEIRKRRTRTVRLAFCLSELL